MTEKLGGPDVQARADRILRRRGLRKELLDALSTDERNMQMTHNPSIAQRVGPDTFLLRGRFVTGDELVADATHAFEREDLIAQLERDTGEPLDGLDVHKKALEILTARGLANNYTDEQYVAACKQAGAR
jgi:hypothetical protein